MRVHDTFGVAAGSMDRTVNVESGRIDRKRIINIEFLAIQVDFHEAGRRDFLEEHSIGIDQELVTCTRDFCGQMGKHQIIPSVHRDQAVRCGEVYPGLPFLGRNLAFDAWKCGCLHGDLSSTIGL